MDFSSRAVLSYLGFERLRLGNQTDYAATISAILDAEVGHEIAELDGTRYVRHAGLNSNFARLRLERKRCGHRIVTDRLRHQPRKVYIMGQRTKWGNCSAKTNLSFNWRLVLAPEFVLRYLVTHEAVHLAIPDHSAKFWLTVQSHCHETEVAKRWLSANGHRLAVDLNQIVDTLGS